MLWVLKRTVSMRRFFWAPKTYVKIDGLENIYNCMLKIFVYLNLWLALFAIIKIQNYWDIINNDPLKYTMGYPDLYWTLWIYLLGCKVLNIHLQLAGEAKVFF